jgi:hypothetical protein
MGINNKYIRPGDSADSLIEKSNFNFDQILSSGFGPTGFNGQRGPTGVIGKIGPDGPQGPTGLRGSEWFQQNTPPATAGANLYDYWITTSNFNQDQIFTYAGPTSGWVDTGSSLRSSGVFTGVQSLEGPEGATGFSAIAINATGPNLYLTTFVFSDKVLNENDANPLRSKVLISTDSLQNEGAILGFSKTTTNSPGFPAFSWASTGTDYSLDFKTNSSMRITSGDDLSIFSTDTISLSGGVSDFKVGGTTLLSSAGPISIISNPSIQLSGSEMSLRGSDNNINVPLVLNPSYGSTGSYKIDITGSGFNTGFLLTSAGPTSASDILKIDDVDGLSLLRVKQNSQTVIGVTGSTGAHYIDSYRIVPSKFIPTSTSGVTTYGIVDLSSSDYFDSNKIMLTFPSDINISVVGPAFYVMIPSPSIPSQISGPNDITSFKIMNSDPSYTFQGISYMERKTVGNSAVLIERKIDFPNPQNVSVLNLTYTEDTDSFFFGAGETGSYVQMSVS